MIKGIKFATIPVRDQDRSLKFYTHAIGCRIVTDQPSTAAALIVRRAD